jgi:hypothetical protein
MPYIEEYQLNNTSSVKIVWDNQMLAQLEQQRSRAIVRDLIRRGNRVQEAARRQVRFGHVGVGGRAAKGGRLNLRDTIHVRLVTAGGYENLLGQSAQGLPEIVIGSESPIARLHHDGTRPHVIVPRNAPYLVFFSQRAGKVVFAKRVMHPGTKPNHYLTDNLHLALEG